MASGGSDPPCNVLSPSATKRARLEEDEQGEVSSWPDQQAAPRPTWLPSTAPCEGERGGSSCGASSVDSGLSDTGATSPLERATPPFETTMDPNREEEGTMPDEQEGEDGEENGEEEEDDLSSLGGLSDMSGQDWKPDMTGKLAWLHRAMARGENPRLMLLDLLPGGSEIPEDMDTMTLWKVMFNLLSEPPRREKLSSVNTLEDCVSLIRAANNIIVLTGAGVSVSCGIPDFRSKDGVYARLAVDFPDLPDPQAMFDIHYFRKDPRPFFKFAREIYPGQFTPSPCHRFIRCLEEQNSLLRNYTQNIDTLEQVSGIEKVIQCHGSFATASCMVCKTKVDADVIRKDIFDQNIPLCQNCPKPDLQDIFKDKDDLERTDTSTEDKIDDPANLLEPSSSKQDLSDPTAGSSRESPCEPSTSSVSKASPMPLSSPFSNVPVMKPDIVFFGEGLPDHFHHSITRDKSSCDLLIVIGSSLKVRPVALIPSSLPPEVPQILINREPLPHCTFDVELLGDCDAIVNQICHMLGEGWSSPVHAPMLDQFTGVPKDFPQIEKKSDETASHSEAGEPSKTYSISEKVDAKLSEADNIYAKESKVVENPSKEVPTDAVELEQQLPTKDADQEDMEEEWKSKPSLSEFIPQGHYLFLPPARYVFSGAEVTLDSSDDEAERDDLESLPDEDQDNSGNKSDDEEAALNESDPAQTADLQSPP